MDKSIIPFQDRQVEVAQFQFVMIGLVSGPCSAKHIDMHGGIEQAIALAQWPYCAMICSEGFLKARAQTKLTNKRV